MLVRYRSPVTRTQQARHIKQGFLNTKMFLFLQDQMFKSVYFIKYYVVVF